MRIRSDRVAVMSLKKQEMRDDFVCEMGGEKRERKEEKRGGKLGVFMNRLGLGGGFGG